MNWANSYGGTPCEELLPLAQVAGSTSEREIIEMISSATHSYSVKAAACTYLGQSRSDESLMALVLSLTHSGTVGVEWEVAAALISRGSRKTVRRLLSQLALAMPEECREAAVLVLSTLGDRRVRGHLAQVAADARLSPTLREVAAVGLGRQRLTIEVRRSLILALGDIDPRVRYGGILGSTTHLTDPVIYATVSDLQQDSAVPYGGPSLASYAMESLQAWSASQQRYHRSSY